MISRRAFDWLRGMSEKLECITLDLDGADAAIIWLHGLGASGDDFVPIVPELGLPENHRIRFVFPHAPIMPVTINGGMEMRAWHDASAYGNRIDVDEPTVRSSAIAVQALVDEQIAAGVAAERIIIAGFSQGGSMALYAGLQYPKRLGGILALSTYLPFPEHLDGETNAANLETPVFIAHGTADPVVEMGFGERARNHLTDKGHDVEWVTYPMEHSIHPHEIQDIGERIRTWLGL